MIKVITYGTYDFLQYGHIRLLERAKALGDYLIVGITTDDIAAWNAKQNAGNYVDQTAYATKISALVYLDGDSVDNSDVANAAQSMTGSMNLQFSTDVDLVPMHYTPLEGTITKPTTATTSGND